MQTFPVVGCSSCGVVFVSACKTSGVVLSSVSGASGDGKVIVGLAYTGGLSGSLQQSNEVNMFQIIQMMDVL